MRGNTQRHGAAVLVAALALVFAVTATAVGGTDALSKAITKSKVKNIAKKQVNKLAPGLSVAKADTATTADSANTATTATAADSAQPVAFAQVDDGGTVNAGNSKNVTNANVTHPATGVYCISGLPFTIKGGMVSILFGGSAGSSSNFTPSATANCPNGGQVLTWAPNNSAADFTFQVLVYG